MEVFSKCYSKVAPSNIINWIVENPAVNIQIQFSGAIDNFEQAMLVFELQKDFELLLNQNNGFKKVTRINHLYSKVEFIFKLFRFKLVITKYVEHNIYEPVFFNLTKKRI